MNTLNPLDSDGYTIEESSLKAAVDEERFFKEAFTSPSGQKALELLKAEFYDCPAPADPTRHPQCIGRRDVVLWILEKLK